MNWIRMGFGRSKIPNMNINKTILVLIASIFILQSCSNTAKEKDIISQIVDDMHAYQSVHYTVNKKSYYSNTTDTSFTPFEVWIVREKSKSTRAGYIWVDNNYRPYNMIQHEGSLWLTIPPKKTTALYSNYKESLIGQTDWIDVFLNPKSLQNQILDTNNQIIISNLQYQGIECCSISIAFPINEKGNKITITYIIDKGNSMPLWAKLESKDNERTLFSELSFSSFEFDILNIKTLKAKHERLIQANPIQKRESNSKTSILENMLQIGDPAPYFTGSFFANDSKFELQDYIGKKIIVIDFWYTHCPPCVRAIPALSELDYNYRDQGVIVFGLNSIDNQARSLKNLEQFVNNRNLSYDIILTQPEVDMLYNVSRYPSIYIIDLDGKIAYVDVGYDEESFAELKAKVVELLTE